MFEEIMNLISFTKHIWKLYDTKKLKRALADEIELELNALENAYFDQMLVFYTIIGASTFGSLFPPKNPEIVIDKLYNMLKDSFSKTEKSIIKLVKTMKIHEEDMYNICENDHQARFMLRDLLSSVDVKEETIDWEYLSSKKHFIHIDTINTTGYNFSKNLNDKLQPLFDDIQIDGIIWDNINLSTVEKLFMNDEFCKKYVNLIQEYSEK